MVRERGQKIAVCLDSEDQRNLNWLLQETNYSSFNEILEGALLLFQQAQMARLAHSLVVLRVDRGGQQQLLPIDGVKVLSEESLTTQPTNTFWVRSSSVAVVGWLLNQGCAANVCELACEAVRFYYRVLRAVCAPPFEDFGLVTSSGDFVPLAIPGFVPKE